MSDETEILIATVDRLFADLAGATAANGALGWVQIEESGIGSLLVPEHGGGFGGTYQDACAVLARAGWHTVALPIAETILARAVLAGAGVSPPAGPTTIAVNAAGSLRADHASGFNYTGALQAVPWGGSCEHVVAEVQHEGAERLICIAVSDARQRHEATNLAGEPRDGLEFEAAPLRMHGAESARAGVPAHTTQAHGGLMALAALMRVAQIAGALEWVLQQCVEHAAARQQFGRSLSQFQVIQHALALLAEESSAVSCAARAASRAVDLGDARFEIAAAQLRASQAIGTATAIAHQVHGAIGCTQEHALQRATRRLWAWRTEFGSERDWAVKLGRSIAAAGARRLWPTLTERGDRRSAADEDAR